MVEQRSKIDRIKSEWRRKKAEIKRRVFTLPFLIALITPVLLVWYFVGTISSLTRNWELQQQIAAENLRQQRLELEIEGLQLENQYYASEEYQELAARRLQNKKMPGETMVYLPKNSEAAKNKYKNTEDVAVKKFEEPSNFKQWLNFLFGA